MRDYLTSMTDFDYQRTVAGALDGHLAAINACVECCDRHALPEGLLATQAYCRATGLDQEPAH